MRRHPCSTANITQSRETPHTTALFHLGGDPPGGVRSHCEPRSECPPAEPGSIVHDVHGPAHPQHAAVFRSARARSDRRADLHAQRRSAQVDCSGTLVAGWLPAQVAHDARQPSPSPSSRKTSADAADFPAGNSRSLASIRFPTLPRPLLARDQEPCQDRPIRESRAAHAARVARNGPPPSYDPRKRQLARTCPCGPTNG
jgi:hypothetical protein